MDGTLYLSFSFFFASKLRNWFAGLVLTALIHTLFFNEVLRFHAQSLKISGEEQMAKALSL